ncbi:MAG: methylenetetrahydrofolate reductase [NAD(P)H] [Candidatus Margulisiibacteriota bacterium]|nr:methylenetetrahydrofolate reductase [NAD(P)H] [Candidatus Margulisiibacteriota bacterium]
MKVADALKKGEPTLSFEFFPPKNEKQEENLYAVLAQLKEFKPDFVSVTYGALGTTREKTFRWVKDIKTKYQIEPVAHLTCVAADKESILAQINELAKMGVENILALRGDPPEGEKDFKSPVGGFKYAKDLMLFIKKRMPQFCLGGAGFPEGHKGSKSLEKDVRHLKEKVDAGAEYIITQLFFDNRFYFDFVERCKKNGINVPIIPGIMPITSLKQVKKMTEMCGASIPQKLLEKIGNSEDVETVGVEHAVSQCRELLEAGVPGLHFFVMNKSGPISKILNQLKM